jgi:hypothetical protein
MTKLLLSLAVVLTAAALATGDDAEKDLKKLTGTWEEVSHVADGKAMTADEVKGTTVVIDASGKWEAFKEKMTPPATATATVGNPPPASPQGEPTSILGTIIKQAIQVLGPAIGGMITGAMAGEAEGAKNGHPDGQTHPVPEPTTRTP